MRRKDREVLGDENIAKIIEQCTTCHIAMVDDADAGMPYVIPMSFGYSLKDGALELYFHCAHVGKKLDCIRKNPNVAEIVEDSAEKCRGLSLLMERQAAGAAHGSSSAQSAKPAQSMYAAPHKFEFTPAQAAAVTVFKITSTNFTGKAKAEK